MQNNWIAPTEAGVGLRPTCNTNQVDEADTKVLEASVGYQKHLDEAATEKGKIDTFKAGIKLRHAKAMKVGDITVNTPETRSAWGAGYTGMPTAEAKPEQSGWMPNIFRNAIEDENNPQNVDKNSTSDLPVVNDPVRIKESKVMQQRMQMAQSDEDANVRHSATEDVKARMADPVKWEAAQYATMQESSDEDLAGKLQVMPQVIEQGNMLLQQAQLEAQAQQEGFQQKLEQIVAAKEKDKDMPFTMADNKVNPTTGTHWHNDQLDQCQSTIAAGHAMAGEQGEPGDRRTTPMSATKHGLM